MVRTILLLVPAVVLFLATQFPLFGQSSGYLRKIDTLTAGPAEDLHPACVRNSTFDYSGIDTWVIFERHTPTTSAIVGKRFVHSTASWDTTEYLLASGSAQDSMEFPGLGCRTIYTTTRMAVWQQYDGKNRHIWYSTLVDTSVAWSTATQLTPDSTDDILPKISATWDSCYLVTWERDRALLGCLVSMSGRAEAETLCVADTSFFEYDVGNDWGSLAVLRKLNGEQQGIVFSTVATSDSLVLADPETLFVGSSIARPRLCISYLGPATFLYDGIVGNQRDVFWGNFMGADTVQTMAGDPDADERNAQGFGLPYITKQRSVAKVASQPFDVCAYERTSPGDSVLVVGGVGWVWSDTIRSAGHNRDVQICCQPDWSQSPGWVPVVWESNRSGISHIYATFAFMSIGGVADETMEPNVMSLAGNYPNPFNPATTITYSLSKRSHVTLTVYDLLGREVEKLVDGDVQAGVASIRFDARNLASGVYFYRMRAIPLDGSRTFIVSKKCLLLR